ncbi:hypothetical protein [Photobacterium leiognathi]|uniref:hypothetical protein n=1 Tax=Photobacterium leiognathi TaxID=553611 RepID=UPI0029815819|nr:hypothetical protein [Photobacterium leiognathi]
MEIDCNQAKYFKVYLAICCSLLVVCFSTGLNCLFSYNELTHDSSYIALFGFIFRALLVAANVLFTVYFLSLRKKLETASMPILTIGIYALAFNLVVSLSDCIVTVVTK